MPGEVNTSSPEAPEGFAVGPGIGGLTRVLITVENAEAEVYLNGATVTRCEVAGECEQRKYCENTQKCFAPQSFHRGKTDKP